MAEPRKPLANPTGRRDTWKRPSGVPYGGAAVVTPAPVRPEQPRVTGYHKPTPVQPVRPTPVQPTRPQLPEHASPTAVVAVAKPGQKPGPKQTGSDQRPGPGSRLGLNYGFAETARPGQKPGAKFEGRKPGAKLTGRANALTRGRGKKRGLKKLGPQKYGPRNTAPKPHD